MELNLLDLEASDRLLVFSFITKEYGKPSDENIKEFCDNFFVKIRSNSGNIGLSIANREKLDGGTKNGEVENRGGILFLDYLSGKSIDTVEELIEIIKEFEIDKKCEGTDYVLRVDKNKYDIQHAISEFRQYGNTFEINIFDSILDIGKHIWIIGADNEIYGHGDVLNIIEVGKTICLFDRTLEGIYSKPGNLLVMVLCDIDELIGSKLDVEDKRYITEIESIKARRD